MGDVETPRTNNEVTRDESASAQQEEQQQQQQQQQQHMMKSEESTQCPSVCPSELELFSFDTLGFLVVRGVLSPAQVAEVNSAIDAQTMQGNAHERQGAMRLTGAGGTALAPLVGDGTTGRMDLGNALKWGGDPLRSILTHPRLIPYMHAFLGKGYRLDHQPITILQNQGAEGFDLHGGPIDANGNWDPHLAYHFSHGMVRTQLLGVSVQLVDTKAGDGGFAIIPGSHKSNFKCPGIAKKLGLEEFSLTQEQQPLTVSPEVRAGDVILFSEACTHGTLAWKSERQRRIVIYRFSPANIGYGRNYSEEANGGGWDKETLASMTDAMKSVLQPPFHPRLDRMTLSMDSADQNPLTVTAGVEKPRPAAKKAFDTAVFGTEYF